MQYLNKLKNGGIIENYILLSNYERYLTGVWLIGIRKDLAEHSEYSDVLIKCANHEECHKKTEEYIESLFNKAIKKSGKNLISFKIKQLINVFFIQFILSFPVQFFMLHKIIMHNIIAGSIVGTVLIMAFARRFIIEII